MLQKAQGSRSFTVHFRCRPPLWSPEKKGDGGENTKACETEIGLAWGGRTRIETVRERPRRWRLAPPSLAAAGDGNCEEKRERERSKKMKEGRRLSARVRLLEGGGRRKYIYILGKITISYPIIYS